MILIGISYQNQCSFSCHLRPESLEGGVRFGSLAQALGRECKVDPEDVDEILLVDDDFKVKCWTPDDTDE